LENAIDAALDARGGWWGQGNAQTFGLSSGNRESGAVQLLDLSLSLNVGRKTGSKSSESATPPSVSLHDVFVTLGQTQQNHIDTQANHPFRIVQRAVILSELPALLTHVESLLPSMRVTLAPQQYIRLARFFAHLVLYLRLIRWDAMPNDVVCNSILKQYVDVLEGVGEDELVALYASSLEAESAVESYAHFLKLMDANEGLESKRSALLRAQTHDLDVAAVAVATVGMIFDEYSSSFTPMTTFTELSTALTPAEDALIKGIDWLCIHPSTFADAVVHINVLMRLFLASGRLHAARKLLFDIPAEVMESVGQMEAQGDVEQQAIELVHWRTFFDALDRHLRFVEVWSRRPTRNARSELLNWTKGLDAIVDEARIAILQILQMDWIKFTTSTMLDAATEQRLSQLASIRQKYIPEMVTRLHTMLYDVHEVLPHTLAAVIQIPVLVADERHKLYLDFIGSSPDNRLQNFIQQIRLAQLAGLKSDPDPFHYASQTMV
jgi:nuclear pore complex protein Nup107